MNNPIESILPLNKYSWLWAAPLLVIAGCERGNQFVPPPPPEVTVQAPAQRTVTNYLGFPGRTEAKDTIEIRARVSGYLETIDFEDGEFVDEGDVLFTIEPATYQAKLEAAQADLAKAKAAYELANVSYQRMSKAFETEAISEIDKLTAMAERDSAEAAVLAAEALVTSAQLDLSYTTNYAPAAGRIGRRLVSEGNLVGGTPSTLLATLIVHDPIQLYFYIDERSLMPLLRQGFKADRPGEKSPEIQLELADGSIFPKPGRFDYLDPAIDPETGTATARAVFDNPDTQLLPGLYGKALVPQVRTNALLVPDLALQRDLSGPFLLAVNAENKVETRYVTPGPRIGDERIIEDGLDGSEQIIVGNLQRARAGITVRPSQASSPATTSPSPPASDPSPAEEPNPTQTQTNRQ